MPIWITTIESALSPSAVCQSLREMVRPRRPFLQEVKLAFRREADPFAFEGAINDQSFKLMRIIGYRNSFLPVIRGVVRDHRGGSSVRLLMTLHPAVALFMAFWFSGVAKPLLAAEDASSAKAPYFWGMIIFGILLVSVPFYYEVVRAKRLIGEKLGAV